MDNLNSRAFRITGRTGEQAFHSRADLEPFFPFSTCELIAGGHEIGETLEALHS